MSAMAEVTRYERVMPAEELEPQRLTPAVVAGEPVCLVRLADRVVAFDDRCPHRGTPLTQGTLQGTTLTCAAHTWEFDVRTGALLRLRAPACLSMRSVRERDGQIEVGPAP